jgi:glucose/arabinose dehydrogenase
MQFVGADRSETIQCRDTRTGAEAYTADGFDKWFSFRGHPGGVAIGSDDTVWVSDSRSAAIQQIAPDGTCTPVIKPAVISRVGGPDAAPLTSAGLAVAPDGSLYVADPNHHRVCVVTPEGETRTLAGGANGYRDGSAVEALFRYPRDVSLAPDGSCYVADTGNDRIRRIAPDGTVTTVAGSIYDYGDGQGTDAHFRRPAALEVGPDGICYVADTGNNTIRRIDLNGTVTTVAGALPGGDADGAGRDVGLRWPTGIAVEPDGTIWIADHGNDAIRRLGSNRESRSVYRSSGRTWPVSVAWHGNGTLVVSGIALHDLRRPEAWLLMVKAR